ncbi:hypothetical protein [Pseudovibrio sp. W64]|uniref:hypothetical protein n=1 Tax=Pseudovibrio sp. W64 TaxID=1735583 RepID=UPI0007AEC8C0|nr:hypothetical protein [Pseudovibrio sp. W64]
MRKLKKAIAVYLKARRYSKIDTPNMYSLGSLEWLMAAEKKYGGYATGVKRKKVSDHDPRSAEKIEQGGMTGGDRMFHHGYARAYAKHLSDFVHRHKDELNIVEIGILKGTGLAMWHDLFPNSNIFALDIDPQHYQDNLANLKSLGAFSNSEPEVSIFDQFVDGPEEILHIVGDRTLDIVIDDGFHSCETIRKTAEAVVPFLSTSFVYFVEDNPNAKDAISDLFQDCSIEVYGDLTVIWR